MCLLLVGAAAAEVPHIANGDIPRDGSQVITPQEIWHRGFEDDDFIFGAIRNVQLGPDGNTYVLDTQLSQVYVFDAQGELLRTLSREGEGPGETRRPEDLVFLQDGSLGICQYINGRIIKVDLEGIPTGTLMPPGFEESGGGMSSVRRARYRGGNFVINGARVVPLDDGMTRTQFLISCDENAQPLVEYLSRATTQSLMRDGWVEKNNYFPSHERWDIDDQGRVLAAAERNEYLINVYEPGGDLAFTFGREYKPWKRTEAQKQEIRDSLTVLRDGERIEIEVEVEDNDASIAELHVRDNGEIWVLTGRNQREQEPGILLAFDVFDPKGVFIRQVSLQMEGDLDEDRFFFLGDDRLALVRGAVQARRNTFGGSRGEEAEVAIHDMKVFAL